MILKKEILLKETAKVKFFMPKNNKNLRSQKEVKKSEKVRKVRKVRKSAYKTKVGAINLFNSICF